MDIFLGNYVITYAIILTFLVFYGNMQPYPPLATNERSYCPLTNQIVTEYVTLPRTAALCACEACIVSRSSRHCARGSSPRSHTHDYSTLVWLASRQLRSNISRERGAGMRIKETDVLLSVEKSTVGLLDNAQQSTVAKAVWAAASSGGFSPAQAFKDAWPAGAGAMPDGTDAKFVSLLRAAAKRHETPAPKPTTTKAATTASPTKQSDPAVEAADKVKKIASLAPNAKKSVDAARKKGLEIRALAKKSGVKTAINLANGSKDLAEAVKAAATEINQAQTDANKAVRARNWNAVEAALQTAEAASGVIDAKLDELDELELEVKETIEEGDPSRIGRLKARMKTKEGWVQLATLVAAVAAAVLFNTPFGGFAIFLSIILVLVNLALNPVPAKWTNLGFILVLTILSFSLLFGGGSGGNNDGPQATTEPTHPAVVNPPDEPMGTPPHP